jgi:hypothetical protein
VTPKDETNLLSSKDESMFILSSVNEITAE